MADETAVPAGPVITPGEQTTEYAAMQNSAWWAKAMIILGVIQTSAAGVVAGINEYQQAAAPAPGTPAPGAHQLALVLMICGISLSVIGGIKKALTETSYITGRSTLKAAALRDAPVAPPQV